MFQAEAVRIAVLQFGLLRAIVCIFELVSLRTRRNLTLKPKLLATLT